MVFRLFFASHVVTLFYVFFFCTVQIDAEEFSYSFLVNDDDSAGVLEIVNGDVLRLQTAIQEELANLGVIVDLTGFRRSSRAILQTITATTTTTTVQTTTTASNSTTTDFIIDIGLGSAWDAAGTDDEGDDGMLLIVIIILAAALLIAAIGGIFHLFATRRKAKITQITESLKKLDRTFDDAEELRRMFEADYIDIYESTWRPKGLHVDFLDGWKKFNEEFQIFIDKEFGKYQLVRRNLARKSAIGVRQSVQTPVDYWPAAPTTPELVIKPQLAKVEEFLERMKDFYNKFSEFEEVIAANRGQSRPAPAFNSRYAKVSDEELLPMLGVIAHPMLQKVCVKPYSVLGRSATDKELAPLTKLEAIVVDAATWQCLGSKNTTKGAAGASASIYRWLNLKSGKGKFPPRVNQHFSMPSEPEAETRALYHEYAGQHVIHTVAPRVQEIIEAVPQLAATYFNVLCEFCLALAGPETNPGATANQARDTAPTPRILRLPVISSSSLFCTNPKLGIKEHMAQLTWAAFSMALAMLPVMQQELLEREVTIEFCIGEKSSTDAYQESLTAKQASCPKKLQLNEGGGSVQFKDGSYGWIRRGNSPFDRLERLATFALTEQAICGSGYDLKPGAGSKSVVLQLKDMLERTRIHRCSGSATGATANGVRSPHLVHDTEGSTVMDAALSFSSKNKRVVGVSAASAYHVGGAATTGGRHALEEAWCTISTLVKSLQKMQFEAPRSARQPPVGQEMVPYIPHDGCVVSPGVQIFRDASDLGYIFRSEPVTLDVCSLAMFNQNPRMNDCPQDAPRNFDVYCRQVKRKFQALLEVVRDLNAEVLVCPDVGCGVFENDPEVVGYLFGQALSELPGNLSEVMLTGKVSFFEAASAALQDAPNFKKERLVASAYFNSTSSDDAVVGIIEDDGNPNMVLPGPEPASGGKGTHNGGKGGGRDRGEKGGGRGRGGARGGK